MPLRGRFFIRYAHAALGWSAEIINRHLVIRNDARELQRHSQTTPLVMNKDEFVNTYFPYLMCRVIKLTSLSINITQFGTHLFIIIIIKTFSIMNFGECGFMFELSLTNYQQIKNKFRQPHNWKFVFAPRKMFCNIFDAFVGENMKRICVRNWWLTFYRDCTNFPEF